MLLLLWLEDEHVMEASDRKRHLCFVDFSFIGRFVY
jgi:hypothetical protein